MKDLNKLEDWTEKKLRTLRNNLNNRLTSFKNSDAPRALQASHVLFDKTEKQCKNLLDKVRLLLTKK